MGALCTPGDLAEFIDMEFKVISVFPIVMPELEIRCTYFHFVWCLLERFLEWYAYT